MAYFNCLLLGDFTSFNILSSTDTMVDLQVASLHINTSIILKNTALLLFSFDLISIIQLILHLFFSSVTIERCMYSFIIVHATRYAYHS